MRVFISSPIPCAKRKNKLIQYRDFFIANGHNVVDDHRDSDVVFLWSCAFRGDYRDNSLREIAVMENACPGKTIVGGCLPGIDRKALRAQYGGKVVAWKDDAAALEEMFAANGVRLDDIPLQLLEPQLIDDLEEHRRENPDASVGFSDQFVKLIVSEGCRQECSYCSERLMFPPYRSFAPETLVDACKANLEATGQTRVMLHSDSLGDYGWDLGTDLPALLDRLLALDARIEIGLQNLNPVHYLQYRRELEAVIKQGRIFHLRSGIQSGSTSVLERMRRPYTRAMMEDMFGSLQALGFNAYSTDVIVGFPGETEADFEATMEFLMRYRPRYVLLSRYMETEAMEAFGLADKIPSETQQRRLESAEARLAPLGVFCSTDGGAWSTDRQRRMSCHKEGA